MNPINRNTWLLLLHWEKGHTQSERLAADALGLEGFHTIVPSQPLGGPDGQKDMVLEKDGRRWVGAVHFPNDEKSFKQIRRKFEEDFKGVAKNNADGFVFVTNQALTLPQRDKLQRSIGTTPCEIYDLERLRWVLDSLKGVELRYRYLGIQISDADLVAAVGHLHSNIGQTIEGTLSKLLSSRLPRDNKLDLPPTGEFSYAELAHFAKDQGKPEMHRAYVIDQSLLPAFADPSHAVSPIIIVDKFPADFADCYRLTHEMAMLLYFMQRSIGLAHMDRLSRDERVLIVKVIERLWRCTVRVLPLVEKCQSTFLMVGSNRFSSSCAHLTIYMSACHFLQEVLQVSEQIGYTVASKALREGKDGDALPYDAELILAKWPDVIRSLSDNFTIHEGYKLLNDAFYDLSAEAVRAVRYEQGLPIIPSWMNFQAIAQR